MKLYDSKVGRLWGYVEVFLREYKERVKILRRRRQDSLRSLGGYGEDRERNEVKERNGEWWFNEGGWNSLGQGRKNFVPCVLSWKNWKRIWLMDFNGILIFVDSSIMWP